MFHYRRLFGKAKYGTIKHHAMLYEKLIQSHPDILKWQDDHSSINTLFDYLVKKTMQTLHLQKHMKHDQLA